MATKSIKPTVNSPNALRKPKLASKLNTLPTNPLKLNIPKLPYNEIFELKDMIINEIYKSSLPAREFARQYKFGLGFNSSMQAIGQVNASCVLISQEIRPQFIIEQIGYYSKQKNHFAPVYVVQSIEDLTENIFGMKALVMTLPLRAPGRIADWIARRTKSGFKDVLNGAYSAKVDQRVPDNKGSLATTFGMPGADILAALLDRPSNVSKIIVVPARSVSDCLSVD